LSSYTDPVEIPHTGYERLGIRSQAKGTFHSYVPAGHELQTAQMHKVAADKFIVNITFGWEHAVAVTDENDAGKLVSHRFPQFSLSEELDPKFLKFIILDENFRHHLWLASPGGAGRNRVLNLTEMLQYEIHIPSVSEQRQIADVLIRLDNLITLHQRKVFHRNSETTALGLLTRRHERHEEELWHFRVKPILNRLSLPC
ncbi:MAG: restriction endonuclease subunit S, partial [Lachnospiraceae bacterium]|nr:restriction endonuclease subunit S [Lachnospiraceae bacterium]